MKRREPPLGGAGDDDLADLSVNLQRLAYLHPTKPGDARPAPCTSIALLMSIIKLERTTTVARLESGEATGQF